MIPFLEILVDPEFNCRGRFGPQEVYELSVDIANTGQLEPIIIQRIEDIPQDERPNPCPWKFRLIAGHRRYMAMDVWLPDTHIKATIFNGLTGLQARVLNFTENLHRQELSIMQEAMFINTNWPTYESKTIAKIVGKPKRWVEARLGLLRLPDVLRSKILANKFNEHEIEDVVKRPSTEWAAAYQQVLSEKSGLVGRGAKVLKARSPHKNRPRGKEQIQMAISLLMWGAPLIGLNVQVLTFVTSALAWAARGISTREFIENRLGFAPGCVTIDDDDKIVGFGNAGDTPASP
jgi:ParB/RepB/Spo0J family partition protein